MLVVARQGEAPDEYASLRVMIGGPSLIFRGVKVDVNDREMPSKPKNAYTSACT